MRKPPILFTGISFLFFLFLSTAAFAQIPRIISYQGVANDATGSPLSSGQHRFTIALYTTATGGTPIYEQTVETDVVVGLFSLLIGPIPESLTFGTEYWLGVKIDEGSELSPRTPLSSSPYALNASRANLAERALQSDTAIVARALSSTATGVVRSVNGLSGAVVLQGAGGTRLSLNGNVLTIASDTVRSSGGNGSAWLLGGNAGTTSGQNYIGTTDDEAFEIHVDEVGHNLGVTTGRGRVLRLEPNDNSPNILGGFYGNAITGLRAGVTIAGGGTFGETNHVAADFTTVSGGKGNGATEVNATVSGGSNNTASGQSSTVGGGFTNMAEANSATVGGGLRNRARNWNATVSGGKENVAEDVSTTIAGGEGNRVSGAGGTIGGGINNLVFGTGGTVAGGEANATSDQYSTVSGGRFNNSSAIGATVGGGVNDTASGKYATVGGGLGNVSSDLYATVAGGEANTASGQSSAVVGGTFNQAKGDYSSIAGGFGLTLEGNKSFGFLGEDPISNRQMKIAASNTALLGNVNLWLANNDSTARQIRFYIPSNTTGNYPGLNTYYSSFEVGLQTGTFEYILPLRSGSVGDVLAIQAINGKKVSLIWQSTPQSTAGGEEEVAGSVSPSSDDVQYLLQELKSKTEELERTQKELQKAIQRLEKIEADKSSGSQASE
ncbi:MAG: hypothetical protein AB7H80_00635 [Candidatus Kapaibacterium sp.]